VTETTFTRASRIVYRLSRLEPANRTYLEGELASNEPRSEFSILREPKRYLIIEWRNDHCSWMKTDDSLAACAEYIAERANCSGSFNHHVYDLDHGESGSEMILHWSVTID